MNILYFNQIPPLFFFLTAFLLFSYYSPAFSVFDYVFFLYTCKLFHIVHSFIILFSPPSPLVSTNSPIIRTLHTQTHTHTHTHTRIYIIMFVFVYMLIFWIFHIWGTWNLCLSEPGLLHLTSWSAVLSVLSHFLTLLISCRASELHNLALVNSAAINMDVQVSVL
jgi:hypothetical protein